MSSNTKFFVGPVHREVSWTSVDFGGVLAERSIRVQLLTVYERREPLRFRLGLFYFCNFLRSIYVYIWSMTCENVKSLTYTLENMSNVQQGAAEDAVQTVFCHPVLLSARYSDYLHYKMTFTSKIMHAITRTGGIRRNAAS